jgi:hypothetical protein
LFYLIKKKGKAKKGKTTEAKADPDLLFISFMPACFAAAARGAAARSFYEHFESPKN